MTLTDLLLNMVQAATSLRWVILAGLAMALLLWLAFEAWTAPTMNVPSSFDDRFEDLEAQDREDRQHYEALVTRLATQTPQPKGGAGR